MKEINKNRAEKIKEYRKINNTPEFDNPDDYHNWLTTSEGIKYAKALETIRIEAKGRGGSRPNSGRKKLHVDAVALNKRVPLKALMLIKNYSKDYNVSENEALCKLIFAGDEHLKCKSKCKSN